MSNSTSSLAPNTTSAAPNTTSLAPTLTPSRCNSDEGPVIPPEILNYTSGTPYCQFNYPTYLANLITCCGNNTEVKVWNNCTQFCESNSVDPTLFSRCIRRILPDIPPFGAGCGVAEASLATPNMVSGLGGLWSLALLGAVVFGRLV